MLEVQRITSFDLPDLAPYRTMRRPLEHRQQGIFVAEGVKVMRRLLESRFEVVSALLTEHWLREFEPLLATRPETIRVFLAQKALLEQLTGFSMFQGALAVGKIPAPISLDAVLAAFAFPRFFVALDGLNNAENLGAVVRNCVAFRVQALIVGETSSSPFLRRAIRSSMGTIFQLPVVELAEAEAVPPARPPHPLKPDCSRSAPTCHSAGTSPSSPVTSVSPANLVHALGKLRAQGVRCIAAHPHAPGCTLAQANLATDLCIVLGNEGYGISSPVLAACDEAVAIPMPPTVDSLNVGSAAAVFFYEVGRQRGFV